MDHKTDRWRELVTSEYVSENYHLGLQVHPWQSQAIK